jgi:PAS domain S-box-containing protein
MKIVQTSEEEFKDRTHWYEAMLDAYTDPISVTDMNKNITFLNKSALTVLGKTRDETLGKYCGNVWNVDICKNERCGIEYMKCGKGKSVFSVGDATFTTMASYITDRHGNNIGHIEVVANITDDMKNAREIQQMHELAENEKFELKAIINAIDESFLRVTYDIDMDMLELNDYTVECFGVPREKLIGAKITDKMPAEEVGSFRKQWKKMLEGEIIKGEGERMFRNGVERIWYIYTPIIDTTGKTCKVMMMGQVIKR